jgi:hypothetical protein
VEPVRHEHLHERRARGQHLLGDNLLVLGQVYG